MIKLYKLMFCQSEGWLEVPDTPSLKVKKIRYPTMVCYRALRWCDREDAECRDVDSLPHGRVTTHYLLFYFLSSLSNQEDLTRQRNKKQEFPSSLCSTHLHLPNSLWCLQGWTFSVITPLCCPRERPQPTLC